MGENTKIEWVNHTFNAWIGCTRISDACDNCYAAAMSHRRGWASFETGAPRHRTTQAYWRQPLLWNHKAQARGIRAKVFGPSLADPFDAEVSDAWRRDYLDLIEQTPWLDYILLTKRPQVAAKFFAQRKVPDNVWPGITAETQKMLALRAPPILSIAAKVHVVSAEPLLGPLDLSPWLPRPRQAGTSRDRAHSLTWVVAGGESGPKARPSHPDWFRALREQCAVAGVPFFFKQWGEHAPDHNASGDAPGAEDGVMRKVGRKAAGAALDGREHRDAPP
jgi:protein gp37